MIMAPLGWKMLTRPCQICEFDIPIGRMRNFLGMKVCRRCERQTILMLKKLEQCKPKLLMRFAMKLEMKNNIKNRKKRDVNIVNKAL